jgi:hypothetical protein
MEHFAGGGRQDGAGTNSRTHSPLELLIANQMVLAKVIVAGLSILTLS